MAHFAQTGGKTNRIDSVQTTHHTTHTLHFDIIKLRGPKKLLAHASFSHDPAAAAARDRDQLQGIK